MYNDLMSDFIVNGGMKLSGTYYCSGAKNAGPKLLITSILSDKKCHYDNIPDISDTRKIVSALKVMGAEVQKIGDHSYDIDCSNMEVSDVPEEVMSARQSVLFIGALLWLIMEDGIKDFEGLVKEHKINKERARKAMEDIDKIRNSHVFDGGKTRTEIIREFRDKRR